MNLVQRFIKDESGATAIEYGLIAAGISVVILAIVNSLGSALVTNFEYIRDCVKGTNVAGVCPE